MRQYLTPAQFQSHPLAQTGGWVFGTMPVFQPGVLEGMIDRACARVDAMCNRRFGKPGVTTLAAAVTIGSNLLPLTSTINLDDFPNVILQVGSGANLEFVQGGTYIQTQPVAPFGGLVSLYHGSAFQYNHSAGEPVVGYWYEQQEITGGSTNSSDADWDLSQQGQIAQAHAPRGVGSNVREVFLRGYPIQFIQGFSMVYPWTNGVNVGDPTGLFINYAEGHIRFPIGYFAPNTTVVWPVYIGGYQQVPAEVQSAVIFALAGELAIARNPYGAQSVSSGVRSASWGQGKRGPNMFYDLAYNEVRHLKNWAGS